MNQYQGPSYDQMINPLLNALRDLGGSGTIDEINSRVAEVMNLSDDVLAVLHDPKKGARSEFEYRLAWTRTYLRRYGLLENSSRGVWALTAEGTKTTKVNEKEVVRIVKEQLDIEKEQEIELGEPQEVKSISTSWEEELIETLLQIEPAAFERLIQRVLRESGFVQVEVTGRSGDGGIDGKGIIRLSGLLGFHVIFQCKRYQGSVGPREVRDFRGAMVGRADKGLFITTGSFTK